MKKNLKLVLMSLVLIPCLLLLTACKKSIEPSDYHQRLKGAADAFYENWEEKDFNISVKMNEESSYVRELTRTVDPVEGTTESVDKDFKTVTEVTANVVVDSTKVDDELTANAKIEGVTKTTETGSKVKADQSGFETYTEVTETKMSYTYINDGTTMKVYVEIEVKEDGVVDEEASGKSVYTYTTATAYNTAISRIRELVNGIAGTFFTDSLGEYEVNGEIEYFKDGKSFGVEGSMVSTEVNASEKNWEYSEEEFELLFKNNLPSTAAIKLISEENVDYLGREDVKDVTSMNYEFEYSASLAAPTGFDSATVLPEEPDLNGLF